MAELSVFEVDILTEILHSSLTISIDAFAEAMEIDKKELLAPLKELQKMRLFQLEGETILVDKDMRKYYESQIP
ncbi:MAG: hypothetical protein ACE5GN_07100 [Waddliaceae bacterium]